MTSFLNILDLPPDDFHRGEMTEQDLLQDVDHALLSAALVAQKADAKEITAHLVHLAASAPQDMTAHILLLEMRADSGLDQEHQGKVHSPRITGVAVRHLQEQVQTHLLADHHRRSIPTVQA